MTENQDIIKKKGTAMRIFLGIVLPPLLAALPFMLLGWLGFLAIMYAYIFVGIQSIIFSIVMEIFITPKKTMGSCCIIGGIAGFIVGAVLFLSIADFSWFNVIVTCLGAAAGALTAYILKHHYHKHNIPPIMMDGPIKEVPYESVG